MLGLMYMMKMVNAYNELVGKEEYEEISDKLEWEKSARMIKKPKEHETCGNGPGNGFAGKCKRGGCRRDKEWQRQF